MARTFFSMEVPYFSFEGHITLSRKELPRGKAIEILSNDETIVSLDPSQRAIVKIMNNYLNTHIEIPENPVEVFLERGDSVLIMQVRGLPQLTDRHEYTQEEIDDADFVFSLWTARGTFDDMSHRMYEGARDEHRGLYDNVRVDQNHREYWGEDSYTVM